MNRSANESTTEICTMCGRSVTWGSGWFVNRVPDFDSIEERKETGRAYPRGDYLCAECDQSCPECNPKHSRHRTVMAQINKKRMNDV